MSDGMPAVWATLAGAVPDTHSEPGPDAAVVTFTDALCCPVCRGAGITPPDPGAIVRPWCRACGGTVSAT